MLRAHGRRAARIAWIDIHTGLGPSGVGERIFAGRDDPAAVARARAWWGGGGATPVTSIYDGSSTSAFLTGLMCSAVYDECPQARVHRHRAGIRHGARAGDAAGAARRTLAATCIREAPPALAARIKQQMKDAFYTDTDEWKGKVLRQGREALFQAADGLAS